MKKRLFAVLLAVLLLFALMPGAAWSAPDDEPEDEQSPAGPHVHAEHLYYIPATQATCFSEGNIGYYVCECGMWFRDAAATEVISDHSSVYLAKTEHTPDEVFLGTPATCAEEGLTAGIRCSVCGEVIMGMEPIPKKPHTFSESWSSDAYGHWHACTECGQVVDWAEHVSGGPATATTPEVCTVCGYQIAPATGGSQSPRPTATPNQGTVHPTERPTPSPTPTPSPAPTPQPGQLLVSRVSFLDTGDTRMEELVAEQPDGQTAVCTLELPEQRPEGAGWYFEGWRCSVDGKLYQPGDALSFRYADAPRVEMTAEWTVLIGRGNYDLSAGMRYRFDQGSFQIDGDSTIYAGGSLFYVREGGNFTIR